jgi:hypothetical protein
MARLAVAIQTSKSGRGMTKEMRKMGKRTKKRKKPQNPKS